MTMGNKLTNVLFAGIGGQGIIKASDMLTEAAFRMNYDVKKSELHGMSQRGGSVVTYVRYGEEVASPIIEEGGADYILAFEQLEAARFLPWLKNGGEIIANSQTIDPMPVITGAAHYPQDLIQKIRERGVTITDVDALSLAEEAGSSKAVNVVLIGVLAKRMHLPYEAWVKTIRETVPQKFVEMNLKAFDLGYQK